MISLEGKPSQNSRDDGSVAVQEERCDDPFLSPEVRAFIVDRARMIGLRVDMINSETFVPRDDADLDNLAPVSNDEVVNYLPNTPFPNASEGSVTFRLMSGQQYIKIFRKSWDNLFPQRHPNPPRAQGHGRYPAPGAPNSDIKWDQPENINNQTVNMMGGTGIFNLGDIRNAKAPQNYNDIIDARDMERHLQAVAAGGGQMPQYPHSQYSDYGHQYGSHQSHPEQSQRLKQVIGLSLDRDEEDTMPNNRDAAARHHNQRKQALAQYQNMQGPANAQVAAAHQAHPKAASNVRGRREMTPEERAKYEYYQQCIPALKCVAVDAIPDYMASNPAIQNQVLRFEEDMRTAQLRQAQYQYAQQQHYLMQQQQQMMAMDPQKFSELNPQQQQQYQYMRHQAMLQQQQLAAAQQQQQTRGGVPAQHAAHQYMTPQHMTPQQQQQYMIQMQQYHHMQQQQQMHLQQQQQQQQHQHQQQQQQHQSQKMHDTGANTESQHH